MAQFENETLGCKFTVPDKLTVRQQLAWYSDAAFAKGVDQFSRWWNGARHVIENWECELLPNPEVSLDEMTDPKQTQIVIWVGLQVLSHMNALDDVPKN